MRFARNVKRKFGKKKEEKGKLKGRRKNMPNKPTHLIYHHSGGADWDRYADTSHHDASIIDQWHQHKGYNLSELNWYIGYHYIILKSGELIRTRNDHERGCHCLGMNDRSTGVLIVGNFDRFITAKNNSPTAKQIETFRNLAKGWCVRYNKPKENVVGHRFFASYKSCPGHNIPDDWAIDLLKEEEEDEYPDKVEIEKKIGILQKILAFWITFLKLKIRFQNLLAGVFKKDFYA